MDPLFDVRGKVILITGASSGIGFHLTTALAKRGAYVIAASRTASRSHELRALSGAPDHSVSAIDMDVTSSDSVAFGVRAAAEVHGKLDVLINNAGIALPQRALEMSEHDFRATLDTNLTGPFLVTRAVVSYMQTRGSIIQMASVSALKALTGLSAYSASKAGLVMMSRTLALELAIRQIRVNVIVPGYVKTSLNEDFLKTPKGRQLLGQIPMRRFADPQDLVGTVVFLCTDASSYMTGATITVDGGFLL